MKKVMSLILVGMLMVMGMACYAESSWNCPVCGQLSYGNYCNNCGSHHTETWTCVYCDTVNSADTCPVCGAEKPVSAPSAANEQDTVCSHCNGSGFCSKCDGAGEDICPCLSGNCSSCNGMGYHFNYYNCEATDCNVCHGTGMHDRCNGTGWLTCTSCNGTGLCPYCH